MLTFTSNPITEWREGMSFAEYCDFPALNQSRLKDFDPALDGCPALYRHRCLQPDERRASEALASGRRYHHFLLEPSTFAANYAVLTPAIEADLLEQAKSERSKATTFSTRLGAYIRWAEEHVQLGRQVVSGGEAETLFAMAEAVRECPSIMEVLDHGMARTEVSAFCGAKLRTGEVFQLKSRFDLVPGGNTLIDLKTCRSASAREFANQAAKLGYDRQAAFYRFVANKNGFDIRRFGFLAQDKFPPYLPCIHWMPTEWMDAAEKWFKKVLLDIAECIRTNRWPGRASGELEPPRWLASEIEPLAS